MKNTFCKSCDYDYYKIQFPLNAINKASRMRFFNSELTKLHPCFSDDCCFDYHLRLGKNGLTAYVVVMQKYKLAEYKNSNGLKPIFIKENKKMSFFRNTSQKRITSVVFCFFLIFCISTFLMVFTKSDDKNEETENILLNDQADFSSLSVEYKSPVPMLFDKIEDLNGAVSSFEYAVNGFNEKLRLSVKNIYPEEIVPLFPEADFSTVLFEKNIPFLNIEINSKIILNQDVVIPRNSDKPNERIKLRKVFEENQITIIEEAVKPFSFKLKLNQNQISQKILAVRSVLNFIKESELYLDSFSISSNNSDLILYFCFSENEFPFQNQVYDTLSKNINVFFEHSDQQKTKNQSNSQKNVQQKELLDMSAKEMIIGRLIRSDGSIIEFYKDGEGKIKQRNQ